MNTKEDKEEDDSKVFAKQILNLKGKYEQFLYFKKYDLTYLEKFIFDDYNIEYFTAREYFNFFAKTVERSAASALILNLFCAFSR